MFQKSFLWFAFNCNLFWDTLKTQKKVIFEPLLLISLSISSETFSFDPCVVAFDWGELYAVLVSIDLFCLKNELNDPLQFSFNLYVVLSSIGLYALQLRLQEICNCFVAIFILGDRTNPYHPKIGLRVWRDMT